MGPPSPRKSHVQSIPGWCLPIRSPQAPGWNFSDFIRAPCWSHTIRKLPHVRYQSKGIEKWLGFPPILSRGVLSNTSLCNIVIERRKGEDSASEHDCHEHFNTYEAVIANTDMYSPLRPLCSTAEGRRRETPSFGRTFTIQLGEVFKISNF